MDGTYSRSPSPVETRHRLSSPTYDEQVNMSQKEIEAFDEYESSQRPLRLRSPDPPETSELKRRRSKATADNSDEWDGQGRKKRISLERQSSFDEMFAPLPPNERPQADGADTTVIPTFSGFVSAARVAVANTVDHADDADVVQTTHTPTKSHGFGFTSAANLANSSFEHQVDTLPTSSPDAPADQDYSDWFSAKIPEGAATGFQSARAVKSAPPVNDAIAPLDPALTALPAFTSSRILFENERGPPMSQINTESPTISGFSSAINYVHSIENGTTVQDWAKPSADALARAAAKLKAWEAEMDTDFTVDPSIPELPEGGGALGRIDFERPALRAMENSFAPAASVPDSPTPSRAGFSRAGGSMGKLPGLGKNKAFKSPLLVRPTATPKTTAGTSYVNSPLNPNAAASTSKLPPAFATPTRPGTSSLTSFTPLMPRTTTPGKSLGLTPRRLGFKSAAGKPKFVTPFKPGMKPGESGRVELEQKTLDASQRASVTVIGSPRPAYNNNKATGKTTFFNLAKPSGRQTLQSSGLRPQTYDEVELSDMVGEYPQAITPENALFYRFHSRSSHIPSYQTGDSSMLGADAALEDLHDAGCDLATREWVNNHWSLILWKLAGMVSLQPQLEADPATRRWCWQEVINQLLYRYERELNSASRPPLRLITTHDAPATCPMVLCVTSITWHDGPRDEDGSTSDRWADVEMTDGWYRIRVAVDDPIERAINRGHIRPGRKLAIQNARLMHKEGREPAEPLEAYTQMNLQICGNSCHLAPWHAKLGFVRNPMVATLDRLTADGGLVTLLDVTVERVYPIAYMEFTTAQDGKKECLGIHNEKEETQAQDRWTAQREAAAQKIRDEYDVKIHRWQVWLETFEARAGTRWQPTDANEHLSADAEDQWLNLVDEPTTFAQVKREMTTDRAGWLAFHARHEITKTTENLSEEIGKELEADYPPRESRSFRVIVVKDARWEKREPLRQGQVHIWDILKCVQTEGGKPGHFEVGERYLISNLMPSHKTAWMAPDIDAAVYFNTTQSTRIQKVKP
ncbi:uncharacterized protein B0H18DRAFT_1014556 [Fomitopsis serialis]|uniref:uncharacterized protein n=1 Tax=Fomitopsis serialis TaxID=139415 RepID=UPI002008087F|nr:uncharacterized protein B0H18DRAFT_1014556 [Neoantrodia serialis]KAH9923670.1 hypothetical protein B0H18DRAFT_1014556 [Neoantrodia serialis]